MDVYLRVLLVTAMAASLVALQPPASAHHGPNLYCSKSGDLCQSVRKTDGVRKLRILLAAKYFSTYRLCVRNSEERVCQRFRIRKRANGTFGSSVRWRRHPAFGGSGAHTVSWWIGGDRIGRKLGFHVKS